MKSILFPEKIGGLNSYRARKITKKDIKEIAKKYDLDPIEIQDIVNDMESDGIRVTKEDIEDMYLNGDLF